MVWYICKHSKYLWTFLGFSNKTDTVFIFVNYSINSGKIISRHWAWDNLTFEHANIDFLALIKLDLGSWNIFSSFGFLDPSAILLTSSKR